MRDIEFPTRIDGFNYCAASGCEHQVPEHVAYLTQGICFQCFLEGPAEALHRIEVIHRAQRIPISVYRPGKKRSNRTHNTKAKSHKVTRAKQAALKRLRMMYPEMYDLLYDEERHKAGLLPIPNRDPGRHERTIKTYLEATGYDSGQTAGAPPHG